MKVEVYKEILEEAIERIRVFFEMDETATHETDDERKEGFLSYWISVVAYERGLEVGRKELQ